MTNKILVLTGFLWLGWTLPAEAGVVPGRWEKVETLPRGTEIIVVMDSSDRLQGSLSGIGDSEIEIQELGGANRKLPRSGIRKIIKIGKPHQDTLWDGIAVGGGVGAGAYLIGRAAFFGAPDEIGDVGRALAFAGIGMGVGALMDSMALTEEEVVYRARH